MAYSTSSQGPRVSDLANTVKSLGEVTRQLAAFRRAAGLFDRARVAAVKLTAAATAPWSSRQSEHPATYQASNRGFGVPKATIEGPGSQSCRETISPLGTAMSAALTRSVRDILGRALPKSLAALPVARPHITHTNIQDGAPRQSPVAGLHGASQLGRLVAPALGVSGALRVSKTMQARTSAASEPSTQSNSQNSLLAAAEPCLTQATRAGAYFAGQFSELRRIFSGSRRWQSPDAKRNGGHGGAEATFLGGIQGIAGQFAGSAVRPIGETLHRLNNTLRRFERLRPALERWRTSAAAGTRHALVCGLWLDGGATGAFLSRANEQSGTSYALHIPSHAARHFRFLGVHAAGPLAAASPPRLIPAGSIPAQRSGSISHAPSAGSVIINSSPTVVINSGEPADIEYRVLEALRKHRDTLFDQWRTELSKRERTEF